MDSGALSIAMNQSKVQQVASVAEMKMAMAQRKKQLRS
jgi:hypothetical protein